MNDEKPDQLKEEFSALTKAYPEIKEIIENNKKLKDINKELKKQLVDIKEIQKTVGHDLRTYFGLVTNLNLIINNREYETETERKQYQEIIEASEKIGYSLISFLSLFSLSKEEIKEKSNLLILENLVKEHIIARNQDMKDYKIGLHLKFNRKPYHKPIEIDAYRPIMDFIIGTKLTNALDFAPELSTINQAFKINKVENLELITENKYAEKRFRQNGMGEGIGISSIKSLVQKMGGDVCTYKNSSQIKGAYDVDLSWGYKKGRNLNEETDLFGIKITIPMSELTKSSEENKEIQ